jgi:hypothetical protein
VTVQVHKRAIDSSGYLIHNGYLPETAMTEAWPAVTPLNTKGIGVKKLH